MGRGRLRVGGERMGVCKVFRVGVVGFFGRGFVGFFGISL